MRIRVLFFGALREKMGRGEAVLEVGEGTIVRDVLNVYKERMPEFAWDSIAVAVNLEYAGVEDSLCDGDEVALLPPVSGGLL
jgi:molybdopterin converting factor subunit 1